MLFFIALTISLIAVCSGKNVIKKHPAAIYSCSAIITTAVILIKQSDLTISNPFISDYLLAIFYKGAFAGALWCIVMWAGAFTTDSTLGKKIVSTLIPIRGELSITAAIITLSHAVTYGISYLNRFLSLSKYHISPATEFILTSIICIALLAIMTPLTILSFKSVRKKMNAKLWKKIQRTAYLFYGLIYIHVLVLYLPQAQAGNREKYFSLIAYSLVFIGYGIMRIRKALLQKKKAPALRMNLASAAIFLLLMVFIASGSYGNTPKPETTAQETRVHTVLTLETTKTSEKSDETSATSLSGETTREAGTTISAIETTTAGSDMTSETITGDIQETIVETEAVITDAVIAESPTRVAISEPEAAISEEIQTQQVVNNPVSAPTQTVIATEATQAVTVTTDTHVFNNGTYKGTGVSPADDEGKDEKGNVYATITITDDVITSIAVSYDSSEDVEYIAIAEGAVLGDILGASDTSGADACCGATRTATGIIKAVNDALNQARR